MAATKPELDGRTALQALSSAALALPAYAAAPPAETQVDYHYFSYREADLAAARSASGQSAGRYDIDGHTLNARAPLGDHYGLQADLTIESMSGASPWFVTPNSQGLPVQVMSGATIEDNRQDLLVTLTRYDSERSLGVSAGYSEEDDYQAANLALSAMFEPAGGQISYGLGLSYSDDTLEPTEGGSARFPERIVAAEKDQLGLQASLTQILDRRTVLQWGLALNRSSGYLSDPYKLVFVEGNTRPDTRPDQRNMGAFFLRLRRHFKALAGAVHLDYRATRDDWSVQTHTLEGKWVQRFAGSWRWTGGLRYYTQSQAEFYAPYFSTAPRDGLMSSDYRLSPYGAVSVMGQLNAELGGFDLALGLEHYVADGTYAFGKVAVESPGLVEFDMLNLRVAYRFD